jgi:8-oxo-dGTP diphosphatase
MRIIIRQLVSSIKPYDNLEEKHIADILDWLDENKEIFRIQKPNIPPKHLVSYFVLIDPLKRKILLMDHINAGLWLPSGGHVEKDEHPKATIEREIQEELNLKASFIIDKPFFITQTTTVNIGAGHTDVSLWYILTGDSNRVINFDHREFNGYKWFDYQEILKTDIKKLDPHLHRFTMKLLSSTLLVK